MTFLKIYLTAIPVFFAIDIVWLGWISRNLYQEQIGHLLKSSPNWWAAALFYLIFLVGLTVFVIEPALAKKSLLHAALFGALFGLVTYATYDLTNFAVMKDWPLLITVVDLIWGAVLSALVSICTYWIVHTFFSPTL